jgi:hypothetical protein
VDLRARPARPGVAHLPEVVLVAEALDALHRHADLLVPDRLGLVVALVDGDPEPVAVEPPHTSVTSSQLHGMPLLEVVAEAEVAEHLEEHEVALGAADVVEVVVLAAGPGALLRADRPGLYGGHLVADEVRLERHHAGDGEQHRRVVRDEARRGHDGVVLRGEEVAEGLTELVVQSWRCRAYRGRYPAGPWVRPTTRRSPAPTGCPIDLHEWISFEDPDEQRTWMFDATFLRSNHRCIYGEGCQGVLDGPPPSSSRAAAATAPTSSTTTTSRPWCGVRPAEPRAHAVPRQGGQAAGSCAG